MSDLKNKVVTAIQGNAVSPNRPTDGQWLIYDASTKEYAPGGSTLNGPIYINSGSLNASSIVSSSITNNGAITISSSVAGGETIISAGATGQYSITVDSSSGNLLVNGFPVTTTAPSAGAADPLPATPAGYLQIKINGTVQFIPYY